MSTERNLEVDNQGVTLTTHYDTDDYERENYEDMKAAGKGFIRDSKGKVAGRRIMSIPVNDAMMLEANFDLDYLAFKHNNDRAAMKRLLQRFPYWRVAEGGI